MRSKLTSSDGLDGSGGSMGASVEAHFRAGLDPGETGSRAFVARPLLAVKNARFRFHLEMAFGARHSPGTFVSRHFKRIAGAFVVRAIGPRAWQLPMPVPMRFAGLHSNF